MLRFRQDGADDGGPVVKVRAGPNLRAIRKTARLLRAQDRLDEITEALLVLLRTSAQLADAVSSDDPMNDTPIYARAKLCAGHATMLIRLADLVGPVRGDSAFDRFLAELSTPAPGANDMPNDRL